MFTTISLSLHDDFLLQHRARKFFLTSQVTAPKADAIFSKRLVLKANGKSDTCQGISNTAIKWRYDIAAILVTLSIALHQRGPSSNLKAFSGSIVSALLQQM